jgi:TetR/AcrR family transcriptional repressor of nem operon
MGRPVQFEREDVLEKAMQAFWDQGYCATSMAELVDATDLKPGSLYAAFQSKQGLFLAALDHYGERSTTRIAAFLAQADSPLTGIRAYFRQLAEDSANAQARRSCFLVNTVLELARHNEVVRERVNRHFDTIEGHFQHALEAARASGELSADKDPGALAAFLMTSIWGLRVLGATAPDAQRTQAVLSQILTLLD